MIQSPLPWWDMLHAWWSEHPKYAFQMVTNSMSGVDWMVSNFEQATSTPPISDTQALDENTLKMIGQLSCPPFRSHATCHCCHLLSLQFHHYCSLEHSTLLSIHILNPIWH